MTDTTAAWVNSSSFWQPEWVASSSWAEHAPFAFWLVSVQRPRIVVELGTHGGYSYFAFCQAIQKLGLDCRAYAVDTWKGDRHAGFYGEDVFRTVRLHNEHRYSTFSQLMRMTFDDAAGHFEDGSIDLLHIDGLHSYDDVKHDFTTWRSKISDRGVVLFHDTNVRELDFGVFRLWQELHRQFPTFEFLHGHGLGVLSYGHKNLTPVLQRFFGLDEITQADVRSAYHRLGVSHSLAQKVMELAAENAALQTKLEESRSTLRALTGGRLALGVRSLPRAASRLVRWIVRA